MMCPNRNTYIHGIVYGWDGVWLDWGWLGCFGLCGVYELKNSYEFKDIN